MTTTQMSDTHVFTTTIQSVGKQKNNDGWVMTLDWKLPGSKFDLVLYGQDWKDIDGWKLGDRARISIFRGSLKNGKEGKYTSDYFWNLARITEPGPESQQEATEAEPEPAPASSPAPSLDHRIAWNSAVNNACHILAQVDANKLVTSDLAQVITDTARIIYEVIIDGPPQGQAPPVSPRQAQEAPEMPVAPPEEEEPTVTPPRQPGPSFDKLRQLNDARFPASEEGGELMELVTLEALQEYVQGNYAERNVRQLTDAEVDEVITAVLEGRVR